MLVRPSQGATVGLQQGMTDVAARPLSTTVVGYQRLNLSRRRGNREHVATSPVVSLK